MSTLLRGAPVAERLTLDLSRRSAALRHRGVIPTLAILRVGSSPGDLAYEKSAAARCARCGVEAAAGQLLLPDKDVDGMTPGSLAGLLTGQSGFAPCTAQACLELLDYYDVPLAGRRAVVVGRSLVVGQPVALLLQRRNATVTVCHTGTRDIPALCREADVLIAAAGRPGLITADCLRPGQTVLDVGVHPGPDGTLCGDVAAEAAALDVALTPVPGGVGSVTSAVLCKHTVQAAEKTL